MTAELVAANPGVLDQLPAAQREAAVTLYLTDARDRLALAVEATGPEAVAQMKAEIATVQEMTKQLGLSKEIRDDATEMVRRAEYSLGKAIRKGQDEGTVRRPYDNVRHGQGAVKSDSLDLAPSPTDFASRDELYGNGSGIMQFADTPEEDFDQALADARDEGNLSRANVTRKVQGQKAGLTGQNRLDKIADLAEKGWASTQIAKELGHGEGYIRQLARDAGITIHADKAVGKTKRHNSNNIAANTVTALEGLAMGVNLIDFEALDPKESADWADSLSESLPVLNRFHRKIKESVQ